MPSFFVVYCLVVGLIMTLVAFGFMDQVLLPLFKFFFKLIILPAGTVIDSGTFWLKLTGLGTAGILAGGGLFSAIAIATVARELQPTHIGVSNDGLWIVKEIPVRVRSGGFFSQLNDEKRHQVLTFIKWTSIEKVFIERPRAIKSTKNHRLCIEMKSGKKRKLELGDIANFAGRAYILDVLKDRLSPHVIDSDVFDVMEAPSVVESYTELWLKELNALPSRRNLVPLVPGDQLQDGRYIIKSRLGKGGQATVYLASTQERLPGTEANRPDVAIKEFILPVHSDASVRRAAAEKFQKESTLLARLEHPQIVKLLDVFVEDYRAYLVLEQIEGDSLQDVAKSGSVMAEKDVIELSLQMCAILNYLHNQSPPVVHRDFTPDNLLLQKNGNLKLIDFSVAKEEESSITGTTVGKHAYISPEQFRGKPTNQSDIYSMGATMYFLLTGKVPEAITQLHPLEERKDLSRSIDEIVAKCTALETQGRYLNVEQIAYDIKILIQAEGKNQSA